MGRFRLPVKLKRWTLRQILAVLGFIYLLCNLKGLPGAWHIRIIKGILTQLHLTKCPPKDTPHLPSTPSTTTSPADGKPHLFAYLKTTTTNIPLECDYNGHKSNSTYFSDLDINRTQLLAYVFRRVLSASFIDTSIRTTQLTIALGGTAAMFRREILPFQKFEIWSRVLSWDAKWVYLVSFFVKHNSASTRKNMGGGLPEKEDILASSIARYVFKDGRRTVSPEVVLKETGLAPIKAEGEDDGEAEIQTGEAEREANKWSWRQFEVERQRGMEIGRCLAGLEGLSSEFDPVQRGVLS